MPRNYFASGAAFDGGPLGFAVSTLPERGTPAVEGIHGLSFFTAS